MTTFNTLPAHILLVHLIVVLAPLTAVLAIVCALWPAARKGHLVWLTLILAVLTTVLTPITTHAGEWLYNLRRSVTPILREHADRGDTMIWFSLALLVVAAALAGLNVAERRGKALHRLVPIAVAVLAVVVGVASIVQVYRIGDSGAQSVWGNEISHLQNPQPHN
ncbi:DUF2231 domain-containing protein [Nocardia stercoris]|uniref:DUF2231 domain-containing protein n=1 Tax=Nocardia stercoris TaxID=2483361 RepID=A0A3M2L1S2_9NOCA|nr:DUF2231 domain-containing protein [Nocardia stercoris]RMI31334.1 hypothetical protein EBN03_18405 [Nocardia stercoris]